MKIFFVFFVKSVAKARYFLYLVKLLRPCWHHITQNPELEFTSWMRFYFGQSFTLNLFWHHLVIFGCKNSISNAIS